MVTSGQNATAVDTSAGMVVGRRDAAVSRWLGVPYAAPPVGRLRFRAPQPVPSWTGDREAAEFAAAAVQSPSLTSPRRRLGRALDEDCLYLNVWSPGADDARRPVLVWIHGGAFTGGSGALYDGSALAALGDVVVVSINYRLGAFGFSDLSRVLGERFDSNLGLRDQIAALIWVRDNIAAFGGDPDRVTVAGESAGAVSISLLMTTARTEGLFRAAIMQSGSYSLVHGPAASARTATRLLRELDITVATAGRLLELPAADLLAAQVAVDRSEPATVPSAPWFDDDLLPPSLQAARALTRPGVAVLAGHNRHEIALFRRIAPGVVPTTRSELTERLRVGLGDDADAVLARYPQDRSGTSDLGTDLTFAMPTRHYAERHALAGGPTWVYRFDARAPLLGATHAVELPYLWNWTGIPALLKGLPTEGRRHLAQRLQDHWIAFVRTGDPGCDWPRHLPETLAVRVLDPSGDCTVANPFAWRHDEWAGRDVLVAP